MSPYFPRKISIRPHGGILGLIASNGKTAQGSCASASIGIDTQGRDEVLPMAVASREEAQFKAGR